MDFESIRPSPEVKKNMIQEVVGFKFAEKDLPRDLQFYVKWEKYPSSYNTFEPFHNLKNSSVFRNYINNMYNSLQAEIKLNNLRMERNNNEKIIATLSKPKSIMLDEISTYDKYEFKAYQIVYHLTERNQEFDQRFDDLFVKDFIWQRLKNQEQKITKLVVEIRQAENITVTIENNIDLSLPDAFSYITTNKFFKGSLQRLFKRAGIENQTSEPSISSTSLKMMSPAAIACFKTLNRGWGIKALAKIAAGSFIIECVGEVLTQNEAQKRADKSFFFPVKLLCNGNSYTVDANRHGNLSRYLKSSAEPNTQIKSMSLNVEGLVSTNLMLFATRDIEADEEIMISSTSELMT